MPNPNGQDVNDQAGAGAAGEGASDQGAGSGSSAGDQGGGVVDQEIEITTSTGAKVKVKASDIVDEKGVPFKNRAIEQERRARTAEENLAAQHEQREAGGGAGQQEEIKPGTYVDPNDGQKYTEEDLNRMYMTGEGIKAQRIQLAQINVRKVVSDVVSETEVKARTMSKYPDIRNPQSPFFQRVAKYMAANDLYGRPNGLNMAAAAVAEQLTDEGIPFTKGQVSNPEGQRLSHTGSGVIPGGNGQKGGSSVPELDEQGAAMARKLGVDPKKMATRLSNYLATKGQPKAGRE